VYEQTAAERCPALADRLVLFTVSVALRVIVTETLTSNVAATLSVTRIRAVPLRVSPSLRPVAENEGAVVVPLLIVMLVPPLVKVVAYV
jgi:hypothetical protein